MQQLQEDSTMSEEPPELDHDRATPEPELRVIVTKIVGMGFLLGATKKIAAAGPGNYVTIRREADNRYDDKAVEVLIDGMKVGYVPRSENILIAAMMDEGKTVKAVLEGETLTLLIEEVQDVRDRKPAAE